MGAEAVDGCLTTLDGSAHLPVHSTRLRGVDVGGGLKRGGGVFCGGAWDGVLWGRALTHDFAGCCPVLHVRWGECR